MNIQIYSLILIFAFWLAPSCRGPAATDHAQPVSTLPAAAPPASDLEFLRGLTRDVVEASRVKPGTQIHGSPANQCGFTLLMPGGKGGYPAFWIRDFAMSLESGFISPDEMLSHLRLVARCQNGSAARPLRHGLVIPPFAIPDHINFDGGAVFFPGTYSTNDDQGDGSYGLRPPLDDHYEFVHLAYCAFRATGKTNFLGERINGLTVLEHLVAAFNAPITDIQTGLVFTDDAQRAVGFGFCDAVYLTGQLLFPSLLRYRAAGQLVDLCEAAAQPEQASALRQVQPQIASNLVSTFGEPSRLGGWLLGATRIGRQPDVWGTLYALHLGAIKGAPADNAVDTVIKAVRGGNLVWEGAVRHVPKDFDASPLSAWEKTAGVPVNTYQNGAYWHTPTGWLISAVRRRDPPLAGQLFREYLQHLRQHDFRIDPKSGAPWECIGPKGYVQNGVYMTSVTLPWSILSNSEKSNAPP
jgi:hypothetical protein